MERLIPTSANGTIPNLYFIGRWVPKKLANRSVMYTTNLGAQVTFEVQNAASVGLEWILPDLAIPQTVTIFVDDQPRLIELNEPRFELQLSSKSRHVVHLYFTGNTDQDEVWTSSAGLALADVHPSVGGQMHAVKPAGPLVAWIGDSITAGCWVREKVPSRGYGADLNYAALLSRKLNWEDYRVAYSAAGIIRYGTGGVPAAPRFINYVDYETPAPDFQPKFVFVNLGTNDWQFDTPVFEMYFTAFMKEVQFKFNEAQIFVMIPLNQSHAKTIKAIAQTFNFTVIPTVTWKYSTTDEVHPDVAGSQVLSRQLLDWLQIHGWV
ncbi:GDSL-type esterase/lipase family protein [Pediococcus acidilactici]|uniref:GDSL-type esterase/lipase family protein n=1 Tax=Pediococcus acidilactici TaxID=1254 RepID=UPI000FFB252F|nr:GDSL-type esterase/lipase family protein [Pediococcus acidilactici]MBW4797657.1 lysophospholipase [Pediococcus acidilactici]MBW9306380.1 lysophospholipase [Pediococcus acidilactici]MCE5961910.1 lysophospholipase [Pediococcus acidilactici]MCW8083079.1 GDSL-type esterase/lipase family protein [Pediococcus acidilactici]MDB8857124.1 GDSL-type esterase/lipase family protein [Pediococcus acidilactici]